MFDFGRFWRGLTALAKASPLMLAVFLLVIVVFAAAPFLFAYREVRARIPGAANILPAR